MAQLTPLSKGLIGLMVVGGVASAAWHLVLKERFNASEGGTMPPAATAPQTAASEMAWPFVAPPSSAAAAPQNMPAPVAEPLKPAPATKPAAPTSPAPATPPKPAPASADPWADLTIDKKGNKP